MVVAQVVQVGLAGSQVAVGQGCAGVGVEILPGVERDQSQQPLPVEGEVLVGQVKGELHIGVQAPVAMAFVEPVGVVGQVQPGVARMCPVTRPRASGRYPQRRAMRAGACGSWPTGIWGAARVRNAKASSGVNTSTARWVAWCRSVRVATARDQHRTTRRFGQQRPDLVGVGGVVSSTSVRLPARRAR
jgi:hypothetical protein